MSPTLYADMEPAGLAVGIVGLAGLFNSCSEALERFDSWKNYDTDSRTLGSRFEVEKLRLKKWGESVGLERGTLSQDHNEALDDLQIASTIHEHLLIIQKICSNADGTFLPLTGTGAPFTKHELFDRGTPQFPSNRSRRQKLKWAMNGKAKHEAQVEDLRRLVQNLHHLVPPGGEKGSRAAHRTAGNDGLGNTHGTNT